MPRKISILGGLDKGGSPEPIRRLDIQAGEILAVVGPTGSGKTQLISDIEQYTEGETTTGRSIRITDACVGDHLGHGISGHLVAEVSQKMNFVIDSSVEAFLFRHARVRGVDNPEKIIDEVLAITNELAGEPVALTDNLTMLSGGQARALMVGDVALISNAPVVLIDEIENAGIDRLKAMKMLSGQGKIVLVVTHDPALMLMAERRVIMKNGAMVRLHRTSPEEGKLMKALLAVEKDISRIRDELRSGGCIDTFNNGKEKVSPWQAFCCTAR